MLTKNKIIIPFICAVFLTFLVFWQFFVKGFIPMPASFMVAWYEPFKSDTAVNGVPTIVHKAIGDDIFRQIYPFKILAKEAFAKFRLPLWNPYNGAGQPLMANLHPGYLNPFSLLLNINPINGWAWFIILQFPLVFLTLYWYTRIIGQSKFGALLSASSFVLSSVAMVRYMYGDYMYALIALPILTSCIELIRNKQYLWPKILIPFSTAFLLISVQPQISMYVLGITFCYAVWRLHGKITAIQSMKWMYLVILGFGISAIQLFPTWDFFSHANVTAKSSAFIFEKFLMPPAHLLSLIIPNFFGNSGTYNFWGTTDYVETALSLGSIPVVLAFIGLLQGNKNNRHIIKFWGLTSFVCSIFTLNWWLSRFIYSLPIPVLSTSIPTRLYLFVAYAISIITGYGLDYLLTIGKKQNKNILFIAMGFIAVLFGVLLLVYDKVLFGVSCNVASAIDCRMVSMRNTIIEIIVFGSSVLVWMGIFLWKKKGVVSFIAAGLTIGLVWGIGIYNAGKILPMSPPSYVMPKHEVLTRLRQEAPQRIFGFGEASFATDFASYYTYFDSNYYDPLYLKRYGEFVSFVNTGDTAKGLTRSDVAIINNEIVSDDVSFRRQRAFDLLGVSTFVYRKNTLWEFKENSMVLPRAHLVYKIEVINDSNNVLLRLLSKDFSYKDTGIVEVNVQIDDSEGTGSAKIVEYLPERVRIHTQSNNDALLVLSDNFEQGWKATIDGVKTKIYRTNYTFRGVVVPSGEHEVVFSYDPKSVRIGLGVTLISSLLVLLFSLGVRYDKIKF